MSSTFFLDRISESLERAERHWTEHHRPGESATATGLTVAITREAGSPGTTLARELGKRLDWPVYDHELVEQIAQDMGLRSSLLDSVDESTRVGCWSACSRSPPPMPSPKAAMCGA